VNTRVGIVGARAPLQLLEFKGRMKVFLPEATDHSNNNSDIAYCPHVFSYMVAESMSNCGLKTPCLLLINKIGIKFIGINFHSGKGC
jgi:hypothetical protein